MGVVAPAVAIQYGPDFLTDSNGRPLQGVACTITVTVTGAAAIVYNDRDHVVAAGNVVNTDNDGNLVLFLDPGSYTITPASGLAPYNITVGPPVYAACTTTVSRAALSDASTLVQVADVLGTLVNDLKNLGVLT